MITKTIAANGGPAFPRPIGNNGYTHVEDIDSNSEQEGMSLRDYFAAHAPKRPQSWFVPAMPLKPEPVWDHEHPSRDCFECSPTNWQKRDDWTIERDKQRLIQWPYAWADAQLTAREMF
jgi:hypothetical protein